MEKSKNYQCGCVSYCERRSLMGLCTSKYDCENQLPIMENTHKKHYIGTDLQAVEDDRK